ncbi:MAG TPA: hypothetical protein VM115_06050 [Vicinamibacterales bacterium]|nr:hypothetical protein [Vicinamibacterales bacterium]
MAHPGNVVDRGIQYGDLNHLQFNPVDPNLLLYCHEGTWHELDRTWTIRTDGSQKRLIHARTMAGAASSPTCTSRPTRNGSCSAASSVPARVMFMRWK